MLYILQNDVSQLIVTVTEKVTLTTPYYLLRLKCESSKAETSCIVTDSSSATSRYNEFYVTETSSPDNLNAEVELTTTGRYFYWIYEQSSSTNLDYENATTLLESGFVEVTGTSSASTIYTDATNEKIIYQP